MDITHGPCMCVGNGPDFLETLVAAGHDASLTLLSGEGHEIADRASVELILGLIIDVSSTM